MVGNRKLVIERGPYSSASSLTGGDSASERQKMTELIKKNCASKKRLNAGPNIGYLQPDVNKQFIKSFNQLYKTGKLKNGGKKDHEKRGEILEMVSCMLSTRLTFVAVFLMKPAHQKSEEGAQQISPGWKKT